MLRYLNIDVNSFTNSDIAFQKEKRQVVKTEDKALYVESIQKSHITDMFSNSEIKINKKGFEIKERLVEMKNKELQMCAQNQAKLEILKAKLGCEPTEKVSEWVLEGFDISIEPKIYSYDSCDWEPIEGTETNIGSLKSEYNSVANNYVKSQIDICTIDTMINNLVDNTFYPISIKQAALLGF